MNAHDEVRARLNSPGGWGEVGGLPGHDRYMKPIVGRKGRRKCHCGCSTRATHYGWANGVVLTVGCEWKIRRWVRDASPDRR